jgi:hypothetical protein
MICMKYGWLISFTTMSSLAHSLYKNKVKGPSKEMGSFTDAAAHLISGLPVK